MPPQIETMPCKLEIGIGVHTCQLILNHSMANFQDDEYGFDNMV